MIGILYSVFIYILKRFKIAFLEVSGFQYVLIGLLLSFFLGKEGESVKQSIEPMIWFCIGLIGFRFGLDFKFVDFGKNNPLGYKLALFDAIITFASVFVVVSLVLYYVFHRSPFAETSLLFSLPLSVIGIVSSLSATQHIHDDHVTYGRISDFAIYTIRFQQIIALVLFGIIFLIFHKENNELLVTLNSSSWTFINLFLPIFLGFFYQIILGIVTDDKKIKILTFSFIAINSGTAILFNFSPILFNLICGVVLANTSKHSTKLTDEIKLINKTVVSLIMIYAGYTIKIDALIVVILTFFVVVSARFFGKSFGQTIANRFISDRQHIRQNVSWLFMSQGRIAIVLGISFYHFFPSDWSMVILVTSLFSVILYEYIGLKTYRNLLIDQEEILVEESVS